MGTRFQWLGVGLLLVTMLGEPSMAFAAGVDRDLVAVHVQGTTLRGGELTNARPIYVSVTYTNTEGAQTLGSVGAILTVVPLIYGSTSRVAAYHALMSVIDDGSNTLFSPDKLGRPIVQPYVVENPAPNPVTIRGNSVATIAYGVIPAGQLTPGTYLVEVTVESGVTIPGPQQLSASPTTIIEVR